jgi:hypothetical protein
MTSPTPWTFSSVDVAGCLHHRHMLLAIQATHCDIVQVRNICDSLGFSSGKEEDVRALPQRLCATLGAPRVQLLRAVPHLPAGVEVDVARALRRLALRHASVWWGESGERWKLTLQIYPPIQKTSTIGPAMYAWKNVCQATVRVRPTRTAGCLPPHCLFYPGARWRCSTASTRSPRAKRIRTETYT